MLHLLRFPDLDLINWEACVAASPGALPYVQAWWLHATAGRWAAVVELGPAGEYRSLLPLPTKWRPGGRVAYQPLFTQQLGLVLTPASQHHELADYLRLAATYCRQLYQQLPPGVALPALPPGFEATERLTYHLDLAPAYPALLQGYTAEYRRRLRKNQLLPQPLGAAEGSEAEMEELIRLFQTYRGPADTGLRARHYHLLRRLVRAAQLRGVAEIRQVRQPATGELLAGALFVRHGGGVIYLFAAVTPAGRAAKAPMLLLDDAIRRHAGQPGQVFDFEGGTLPGIGRFFANFGARPVLYAALTLTPPNWFSSWMRP
ncbi:hypothetical protein A0257_08735 [Hymenobacter psoromatis]|nr:hypothetical protein A0257_08735 [Hymenobacter psoromatis]